VAGFRKHGNKPSGSINCGKFLDFLSGTYIFKKDYATWGWLVICIWIFLVYLRNLYSEFVTNLIMGILKWKNKVIL
jgi:hypothetical protein